MARGQLADGRWPKRAFQVEMQLDLRPAPRLVERLGPTLRIGQALVERRHADAWQRRGGGLDGLAHAVIVEESLLRTPSPPAHCPQTRDLTAASGLVRLIRPW